MPATRRVVVVLNSSAGGHDPNEKDDLTPRLLSLFESQNVRADVVSFEDVVAKPSATTRALDDAIKTEATIVAAGGDGTVSGIVQHFGQSGSTLGILPLGTLNHFAKDLGLPLELEKAVEIVCAGVTRTVDLSRVNDRRFVNNCSIGVYPSIVRARDELRNAGHAKWSAFIRAAARVLPRQHRIQVRLEADGVPTNSHTPFVLIANNEYETAGFGFGERKSLDAGRLFVYVAPEVHALELPVAFVKELIAGLFRREGAPSEQFNVIDASELWIDAVGPRTLSLAIDGELVAATWPLHFQSEPKALRVLAPLPEPQKS